MYTGCNICNTNWLMDVGVFFHTLSCMLSPARKIYPPFNYSIPIFSYPPIYPLYPQNCSIVGNTLAGVTASGYYSGPSLLSNLNTINTSSKSNYNLVGNTLSSLPSTALYCGGYNCYDTSIIMPPMYGTGACTTNLGYASITSTSTQPKKSSVKSSKDNVSTETGTSTPKNTKPKTKTPAAAETSVKKNTAAATDSTVIRNKGKVKISKDIEKRVKQIAGKINCDYKDLLGLIWCESNFDPAKWHGTSAIGLIQFTDVCIDELNRIYNLNLTKEKIAKMSALEQLDLVEKSLLRSKEIAGFSSSHKLSAAELYIINLAPAYAKRRSYILSKSDSDGYYNSNKGLDINKDGYITRDELKTFIQKGKLNVTC